jgi:hypothetical protein
MPVGACNYLSTASTFDIKEITWANIMRTRYHDNSSFNNPRWAVALRSGRQLGNHPIDGLASNDILNCKNGNDRLNGGSGPETLMDLFTNTKPNVLAKSLKYSVDLRKNLPNNLPPSVCLFRCSYSYFCRCLSAADVELFKYSINSLRTMRSQCFAPDSRSAKTCVTP